MSAPRLVIAAISVDCEDPEALARFYATVLSGSLLWSTPSSVGLRCGSYVLIAARVEGYAPPQWPGSAILHLDLNGDADVVELVGAAVAAGARVADHQPDRRWTVLLDPAGHPFCITPYSPPDP